MIRGNVSVVLAAEEDGTNDWIAAPQLFVTMTNESVTGFKLPIPT